MKYDLFDLRMIISKQIIFVGGLQVEQFQEITLKKIRLWQDSNLCLPNTNWTLLPTETMAQMVLKLKNFTDMNLTFRFNFFFYRFKSFLKTALLFAI